MNTRQIILLLVLGVVSASLGYALAHVLFAEGLIRLFAGSGTGEWERGVVSNWATHALCSGPLLVALGSVFAVLVTLLDKLVKVSNALRLVLVAALAAVAAFVAYLPLQVLMLLADAF
jgi:hypothetical protein